MVATMSTRST
jgi:hypothetical protein